MEIHAPSLPGVPVETTECFPPLKIKLWKNLLDMLIPIILVVGWVIKGLLSGNAEEDNGPQPRSRSAPDESYPDTEYEARQRRIQEEIRRKIMERRQAAEGGTAEPPELPGQQRPVVTPDHVEAKRRRVQERLKQRKERQKEVVEQVHETPVESETAPGGFSWNQSDHAYEHALEAQRARLEETKRQAAALQSAVGKQLKGKGISDCAQAQELPWTSAGKVT